MYLPSVCEDVENQAGIWDVMPCSKNVIQTVDTWRKANALGECVSDVAKMVELFNAEYGIIWDFYTFPALPCFWIPFVHYCERFGSDDNSEVKVSVSPLQVLSERVCQLETLRIHELRRRLTAASLISSFRRLSLSEQRMLVGIDIDEAVRYVAGKRLP